MRWLPIALLAAPSAAVAQTDLELALAETFTPVEVVENVPTLLSCAALYRALSLAIGEETDTGQAFTQRESYLASIAGVLWFADQGQAGQSESDILAQMVPPIDAATEIFFDHMEGVAATGDSPFDEEIFGQLEFCDAIYTAMQNPE